MSTFYVANSLQLRKRRRSTDCTSQCSDAGAHAEMESAEHTHLNISRDPSIPPILSSALLGESSSMPSGTQNFRGFDFYDLIEDTQSRQSTRISILASVDAPMREPC